MKNKILNCTIIVQSNFANYENNNVMNWKSTKVLINQQNTKSIQKTHTCWQCD